MLTGNLRTPRSSAPSIEAAIARRRKFSEWRQSSTIRTLLSALRAGQEWAFETMVRLYGGRLLAVARRFTRNDEDAQDVVQSAYLSAFRALNDFEGAVPTFDVAASNRRKHCTHEITVTPPKARRVDRRSPARIPGRRPSRRTILGVEYASRSTDGAEGNTCDRSGLDRTAARELPRGAEAARHRRAVDARSRRDAGDDAYGCKSSIAPRAPSVVHLASQGVRVDRRNLIAAANIQPATPCRAIRFRSTAPLRRPIARRSPPRGPSSPGCWGCAHIGRCTNGPNPTVTYPSNAGR